MVASIALSTDVNYDMSAIVVAAGGDGNMLTNGAYYEGGRLYVPSVSQAALSAVGPNNYILVPPNRITRSQFIDLFTEDEQNAIEATSSEDVQLSLYYRKAGDGVNLNSPATAAGMQYLCSLGLLTPQRCARIFTGLPPE